MRSFGYLLCEGFKNLWKNRTMSIASIAVLISCLLLTGIAVLLSINMDSTMNSLESKNSVTIYLQDDLPKLKSVEIGEEIRNIKNILSCEYITREQALDDIMNNLGSDGDIFLGMDNFLPDAYNISLEDLSLYDETIDQILQLEGVDKATDYSDIAAKLTDLDTFIHYASMGIIAILSIVSLFILANTLKVTMYSRKMEIQIMKSVGATNLFIRIPFFVEGMLIGLISGLLSATILYFSYAKIGEFVYSITTLLDIIDIKPYTTEIFVCSGGLGILFGLMGGLISIGRYLKKEGEKAVF